MPNAYGYTGIEERRAENALDVASLGVLTTVAILFTGHTVNKSKDKMRRITYKKYPMNCIFRGEQEHVTVHIDNRIPKEKRKRIAEVVTSDRMMNALYTHVVDTAGFLDYSDAILDPDIDVYYEVCGEVVSSYHLKIAYMLKGIKYNTTRYIYDVAEKRWTDQTRL